MKNYCPLCTLLFFLLHFQLFINAQSFKPLDNYQFDSSYRIIGIANQWMKTGGHSEYNFIIDNPEELEQISKNWKLKDRHQSLSLEDSAIKIYVVRGKELLDIPLLIYPQQTIANYKGNWYEFDVANITNAAQTHPLICHSQDFAFDQYSEYIFFEDSIQADAHLLFLVKPSPRKFPGHFNVYLKQENRRSPSMSAMSEVHDYLSKKFFSTQFEVSFKMGDPSPDTKPDEVKIEVQCDLRVWKKFKFDNARITEWVKYPFECRAYFKD